MKKTKAIWMKNLSNVLAFGGGFLMFALMLLHPVASAIDLPIVALLPKLMIGASVPVMMGMSLYSWADQRAV